MSSVLYGITWDHERGYDPLVAVSTLFHEKHHSITVNWRKRSLKDFGDYPLEKLIPDYDMVMLDHPFTGEALAQNLLLPLNDLLDTEHLNIQQKESLGPCFSSYIQDGKIMALPVDAATLVSVAQQGVLDAGAIPKSWDDIIQFCKTHGKNAVAMPLCSVDIWCVYLSLCAQCADQTVQGKFFTENGIDEQVSIEALERLYELISYINPCSFFMNPISLLNAMTDTLEILYSPFIFGYTNYSRLGYRKHVLVFFDAPTLQKNAFSTVLGGVGIGISAHSKHPHEAALFVKLLTTPHIQQGIFTRSGGQPAHKSAWLSDINNQMCHNFFSNTKNTLEHSYVRPRFPKFNVFQEQVSIYLHNAIQKHEKVATITHYINNLLHSIIGEQQ